MVVSTELDLSDLKTLLMFSAMKILGGQEHYSLNLEITAEKMRSYLDRGGAEWLRIYSAYRKALEIQSKYER